MTKDLKKRIITSFILLLFLLFAYINNFILGYILIVVSIFSILEFIAMSKIFLKKNKILQLISNLIFLLYLFYFCTLLLTFSFSLSLKVLIFIILLTCIASDIGGFIFGKILRGPKLTKISPNKTIAGAIGSLILSSGIVFFLIYFLTNNYELKIIIVGLTTSLGCQFGDLFFSFLKRKSSLKDTGNFLPGHGGILDRIDGMLIGIPIGFLGLLIIY